MELHEKYIYYGKSIIVKTTISNSALILEYGERYEAWLKSEGSVWEELVRKARAKLAKRSQMQATMKGANKRKGKGGGKAQAR